MIRLRVSGHGNDNGTAQHPRDGHHPPRAPPRGTAFLAIKGVRDTASGLVVLALLLTTQRRALGWVMAALTFVPAGDMVIVLTNGHSPGTAYGVHGLTALAVAATAALLLRERPSAA